MKILGRELKPCPFCGKMNPQITFEVVSDAGGQPFVKHLSVSCCADIDIDAPVFYEYDRVYMPYGDAIDKWNERATKGDEIE